MHSGEVGSFFKMIHTLYFFLLVSNTVAAGQNGQEHGMEAHVRANVKDHIARFHDIAHDELLVRLSRWRIPRRPRQQRVVYVIS